MLGVLTGLTAVVSVVMMVLALAVGVGVGDRVLAERVYHMWALTFLAWLGYHLGPWLVGVIA